MIYPRCKGKIPKHIFLLHPVHIYTVLRKAHLSHWDAYKFSLPIVIMEKIFSFERLLICSQFLLIEHRFKKQKKLAALNVCLITTQSHLEPSSNKSVSQNVKKIYLKN